MNNKKKEKAKKKKNNLEDKDKLGEKALCKPLSKDKELDGNEKKKKGKKEKKEKNKNECHDIPIELMDKTKSMAPMRKEEWEKKQSVVKKVYDEETGRYRMIKGDGEVLEEIVSKERHKEINKQATKGDGNYFENKISQSIK